VYKRQDIYFVVDGHHRVSVARQQNQHFIDAEGTRDIWEAIARAQEAGIREIPDLILYGVYRARLKLIHRARTDGHGRLSAESMPATAEREPIGRGDHVFNSWAEREAVTHALEAADRLYTPWYARMFFIKENRVPVYVDWLMEVKRTIDRSTPP